MIYRRRPTVTTFHWTLLMIFVYSTIAIILLYACGAHAGHCNTYCTTTGNGQMCQTDCE